jgi:L,D-transpeptidase ErfK/SrfK
MMFASISTLWGGLLLAVLSGSLPAGLPISHSNLVVGGAYTYTSQVSDSLARVGARFGIDVPALAELNGLNPNAWLEVGQELLIENHHLVPTTLDDGIIINIPQRMLFHFKDGRLQSAFPAGLGRRTWPTRRGDFEVLEKETDKTWIVPLSIQQEMLRKGLPVKKRVPPGPDNPLGRHWIRISETDGIHGTNAPASIYKFQTHGCIRLSREHIANLYQQVSIGTPVRIIYEPVLLARLQDGNYYLEVHPDVYRESGDPFSAVRQLAAAAGADSVIDWQIVLKVIRERRGLAENVTLPADGTP